MKKSNWLPWVLGGTAVAWGAWLLSQRASARPNGTALSQPDDDARQPSTYPYFTLKVTHYPYRGPQDVEHPAQEYPTLELAVRAANNVAKKLGCQGAKPDSWPPFIVDVVKYTETSGGTVRKLMCRCNAAGDCTRKWFNADRDAE